MAMIAGRGHGEEWQSFWDCLTIPEDCNASSTQIDYIPSTECCCFITVDGITKGVN